MADTKKPEIKKIAAAKTLRKLLADHFYELDRAVKGGDWPREFLTLACGKTLGIVGTGAIGLRTAVLGRGLGMNVIAWSRNADPDKAATAGFRYVELDELLRTSDVVSIHLRLTEETEGFISADRLAMIKPSAILVNTARGAIVDESALAAARAWPMAASPVPASTSSAPSRSLRTIRSVISTTSSSRPTMPDNRSKSSTEASTWPSTTSPNSSPANPPTWSSGQGIDRFVRRAQLVRRMVLLYHARS